MKILCIADTESKSLWDYYDHSKLKDIDLIISCGDLDPDYLEFLVTMGHAPLLYVHGNHDDKYMTRPPEGCECIEDRIYEFKGIRILGLGGSMRYRDGAHMYTELEMRRRIWRLMPSLFLRKGFDILVTHAPARGWGDLPDLPHLGFECFLPLIKFFHPRYMVHGHVHRDYGHFQRERVHPEGTRIINAYESCVLDMPDRGELR